MNGKTSTVFIYMFDTIIYVHHLNFTITYLIQNESYQYNLDCQHNQFSEHLNLLSHTVSVPKMRKKNPKFLFTHFQFR